MAKTCGGQTVSIDPTPRAVAKAVPHAQLIEYDGEAHGVFATQTERLTNDLLAFLGGNEGSAFSGLEGAAPEARQDIIDEVSRQSLVTPVV